MKGNISDIVLPITLRNLGVCILFQVCFLIYTFIASKFLPGYVARGVPEIEKGRSKNYLINGYILYPLTLFIVAVGRYLGYLNLVFYVEYFLNHALAAFLISLAFTSILIVVGRLTDKEEKMTVKRKPGNFISDLGLGAQLNPEFLGVDLKVWCNRPGLISLVLINLSFADYQYNQYGQLSSQMIAYQLLSIFYVAGHYLQEDFLLYAYDVLSEYFGMKLIYGILGIMPFLYPTAGWYLADQPESIPWYFLVGDLFLAIGGGVLAKISDLQKFNFRKYGEKATIRGKPVQIIKTEGRSILISGLWGVSRHMNYCGEILLFFGMSLLSGFSSWKAYICPLFIVLVLIPRANDDDHKCRKKYGKYWEEYCRIAKYKVFPYLY